VQASQARWVGVRIQCYWAYLLILLLYGVTYRQTQVYLDKVIHKERHIRNLAVKIQSSASLALFNINPLFISPFDNFLFE
jgi:hypothetical protein